MNSPGNTPLKIRPAEGSDLNVVMAVLAQEGLVTEDVAAHVYDFQIAVAGQEMAGFGGFEVHDQFALLRSVVVLPKFRGQGVARQLCKKLENDMRAQHCQACYLLSEGAQSVFTHLGFVEVSRAEVPEQIKATQQFSSLCPDSATVMMKSL